MVSSNTILTTATCCANLGLYNPFDENSETGMLFGQIQMLRYNANNENVCLDDNGDMLSWDVFYSEESGYSFLINIYQNRTSTKP